nr:genetic suppressor element 1 [Salvelinus alpinus]
MDRAPELEDKKRFLTMFSLSHVSVQQRRDNETVVELLQAIKQKSVTLDTIRHAPQPLCKTPQAQNSDPASTLSSESDEPLSVSPSSPGGLLGQSKPPSSSDALRPKDPPPPLPYPEKTRGLPEGPPSKRTSSSSLLNSLRPPMQPKDAPPSLNGRTKPWESFTAEEFAQQFHESVLQSTQKALQKHKGGATVISAPSHLQDSSVHYNIPELQSTPSRAAPRAQHTPSHTPARTLHPTPHSHQHPQPNGSTAPHTPHESPQERGRSSLHQRTQKKTRKRRKRRPQARCGAPGAAEQCRRLENQHYNLSLTAEQLSHSMGSSPILGPSQPRPHRQSCNREQLSPRMGVVTHGFCHSSELSSSHTLPPRGLQAAVRLTEMGPVRLTEMGVRPNSRPHSPPSPGLQARKAH